MHMLTILRLYLGRTQVSLAKDAHITQPNLSEMEQIEPYGRMDKYRRVAKVLGIPIDPILKNDISGIPLSFFEENPPQSYLPAPERGKGLIGRQGEDFIFEREQKRLEKILPIHARLVLPLYKMKSQRVGYDILSFDDNGIPVYLEVKTSREPSGHFVMTKNELEMAQKLTGDGEQYKLICINDWGSAEPQVQDIPFNEFLISHNITARRYCCMPKRKQNASVTGLAYYRRLHGLKEGELAEALEIPEYKYSLYETADREPPVRVVLQLSKLLGASADDLLRMYPVEEVACLLDSGHRGTPDL